MENQLKTLFVLSTRWYHEISWNTPFPEGGWWDKKSEGDQRSLLQFLTQATTTFFTIIGLDGIDLNAWEMLIFIKMSSSPFIESF